MKTHLINKNEIHHQVFRVEFLAENELRSIKGGISEDNKKNKETDIYDTREV